jgi:hypothetical protein
MNLIKNAYDKIRKFEKRDKGLNLSGPDLADFTELMSEPDCGALRLFLAIGEEKSTTAQWMADFRYDHRSAHSCYRNDSFCLAQLFDLDDQRKKESRLWVIENGLAGYYEAITHAGFNMNSVLFGMGVEAHLPEGHNYHQLQQDQIRGIAKIFGFGDEDLAGAAENVVNWILKRGYNVEVQTSVCADSPLPLFEAEELARTYLSRQKQGELGSFFDKAIANKREGNVDYFLK